MAGLPDFLKRRIAHEGPLTIVQYMESCLAHPEFGYYMTRDPLGRAGDFITAPEISQMFGELIGLWAAQSWQDLDSPTPFKWVEFGPGRGTLSADALRAMAHVPGLAKALQVHLIEISPVLRGYQEQALGSWHPKWHKAVMDIPDGPGVFVANEFFDALPVRQFIKDGCGWRERMVATDNTGGLAFTVSPRLTIDPCLPAGLGKIKDGETVEVSPASISVVRALADRLRADDGVALIIDYGHASSKPSHTLQAVQEHAYVPILETPGEADLTAHVDFAELARTALQAGADLYGPVAQGNFLKELGIEVRAQQLCKNATPKQRADIESALKRLTAPDAMGRLFKVMALAAPRALPPAGFKA